MTNFTYQWAWPSAETFSIGPIREFVRKYYRDSRVSVDPFARNCGWATHTNDLDHRTSAEHHMDARDFLKWCRAQEIRADLVIWDPPYSPRQIKEVYDGIGLKMKMETAWRTQQWAIEKAIINDILEINGVFLHFGWNTVGIGRKYPYTREEVLLVCHGSGHNDTICLAERKNGHQTKMDI